MSVTPLTADDPSVAAGPAESDWVVLDDSGAQVLESDNVVRFETVQEYRLPNYPQEKGAFSTYNKVQVPFEVRMSVSVSGSVANRQAYLAELKTRSGDTNLYSVQTPVDTYDSVNIDRFEWAMADGSAQMIKLTIYFLQIRVTASTTFSNTAQASGADPSSGGTVQPQTPAPTPKPPPTGVG